MYFFKIYVLEIFIVLFCFGVNICLGLVVFFILLLYYDFINFYLKIIYIKLYLEFNIKFNVFFFENFMFRKEVFSCLVGGFINLVAFVSLDLYDARLLI